MTNDEYNQYKEFLYKLKFNIMTLDDYEIIFNRLGGNGVIKYQKDDEWILYTMCHNLNSFEGSPKLYFYTETRTLYCYTKCNQGFDLYELIKKRFELQGENKSIYQCVKWLCNQLNIPFNFKDTSTKTNTNKYNWKSHLIKYTKNYSSNKNELKIYDKNILNYFEECYPLSWINENISLETMIKYGIRYYPYHDSIIIPCVDYKGDLCGIRERFMNPNAYCKYLPLEMIDGTSYEFPVNQTLYGLNYNSENIRHYGKVCLFEAEKATMQCDTYFGCKNFSVSLYGKSMSDTKAKQILALKPNEVIICLDFDYNNVTDENDNFTIEFEKFKNNIYRIGDYFKPYCEVTALISYSGHNKNDSPTDNGKEWYLSLFNNRENLY